eukprot:1750139-Rhodomonas_salina.4
MECFVRRKRCPLKRMRVSGGPEADLNVSKRSMRNGRHNDDSVEIHSKESEQPFNQHRRNTGFRTCRERLAGAELGGDSP